MFLERITYGRPGVSGCKVVSWECPMKRLCELWRRRGVKMTTQLPQLPSQGLHGPAVLVPRTQD